MLATARADGGNSGVSDGPAPLGRAPVTGSAAVALLPPLLWGRGGLVAGCHIELVPGLTKSCLAAVDTSNLTVEARWLPPGQDINVATAVLDDSQQVVVTTAQGHLFVVARPDGNDPSFRVDRDVDLGAHLGAGQGLLAAVVDTGGNLWFVSGGPPPSGAPSPDTTVGYVTPDDQVVTAVLANQRVETGLAVDQGTVYLATAPAGTADHANATGEVSALTAAPGQVSLAWQQPYDAGSGIKPGGLTRGSASPVMLLGRQYLAITDNADDQAHLLVFLRGALPALPVAASTTSTTPTSTSRAPSTTQLPTTTLPTTTLATGALTTTTSPAGGSAAANPDRRLVCSVGLFTPGASAVTTAPIAYSAVDAASVIVADGLNTPPPVVGAPDGGPANDLGPMTPGVTRVDVALDATSCTTVWTTPLRVHSGLVASSTTGLVYGYTQDVTRAAAGSYIWYFVAIDYRTGRIVWRQRAGAGSTKNDNRRPLFLGANGVLYQTVPLGLEWMRDVAQRP